MEEFIERWADAWAEPTPERVGGLCAPGILMSWPGVAEPIWGVEAWMNRVDAMLARLPDLRLEVTGQAWEHDVVFISWRAHAAINGVPARWQGIDRMRLRDGVVVEALVAFDTAGLRP